ncbi:MAG: hypothetical protein U9O63_01790 [Actinomycetota bacterium]|nr:hypothetical protein [Actinomycetota bacterium]
MRRLALPLIAFALLASACSGGSDDAAAVPSEVVATWFDAVESGDVDTARASVVDGSLAVVLAVENSLTAEELAGLVADGVPDEVAAAYWASFREGFSAFAGRPMSTLAVGDYDEFESEGEKYAAVAVTGSADTATLVFTRLGSDGAWEVDLVASLGSGFVGHLRETHALLPQDETGTAARDAYREIVVPAMWAAMAAGDFGDDFTRQALALIDEMGDEG